MPGGDIEGLPASITPRGPAVDASPQQAAELCSQVRQETDGAARWLLAPIADPSGLHPADEWTLPAHFRRARCLGTATTAIGESSPAGTGLDEHVFIGDTLSGLFETNCRCWSRRRGICLKQASVTPVPVPDGSDAPATADHFALRHTLRCKRNAIRRNVQVCSSCSVTGGLRECLCRTRESQNQQSYRSPISIGSLWPRLQTQLGRGPRWKRSARCDCQKGYKNRQEIVHVDLQLVPSTVTLRVWSFPQVAGRIAGCLP